MFKSLLMLLLSVSAVLPLVLGPLVAVLVVWGFLVTLGAAGMSVLAVILLVPCWW